MKCFVVKKTDSGNALIGLREIIESPKESIDDALRRFFPTDREDLYHKWLNTPNENLLGEKPQTLINNGNTDLLWAIIVDMNEGVV